MIMLSNRQLFLQHVAQTSEMPLALEIEKAEAMYLYTKDGCKYMDLIAGISVSNLGHCHPKVVAAIKKQADLYLHTLVYGEFVLTPQVELATRLAKRLPSTLDCTYFVNSGTEATEGAMKLAKRYTGRQEILACKQSYHGSTQGALSLMSEEYFTNAFQPLLPNIGFIEFNREVDLEKITNKTAALIVETVRAEVGVQKPENDYLKKLRARCTETGTLLILDEIQVGCGRTGTMFAFEQYDIIPDILLLAKGFGGGMPIGAFISSKAIMQSLTHDPVLGHITTFGGHPVSCAAALANMQVLEAEYDSLIATVKDKENLFLSLLKHPDIKAIRSAGLLMAVELESFDRVLAVIKRCMAQGLVTDWFLFNANALRIAPPLIISEAEIRAACQIILTALDETIA